MLDQAFEALKTYDWGSDPVALAPIEDAIVAAKGAGNSELEQRLIAVLSSNASRDAKDYVCRKLMHIGTAAATPALSELLSSAELSHMARYALERIPAPEAGQALRDALTKVEDPQKIGVLSSLGKRQEPETVAAVASALSSSNAAVVRAAVLALGAASTPEAMQALGSVKSNDLEVMAAVADARLAGAEALLAADKKSEAMNAYKALTGNEQPKHVKLAATRGLLACVGARN
jgi:HEAT repeat protein